MSYSTSTRSTNMDHWWTSSMLRMFWQLHKGRDDFRSRGPWINSTVLLWNRVLPVFQSILLRIYRSSRRVCSNKRHATTAIRQERLPQLHVMKQQILHLRKPWWRMMTCWCAACEADRLLVGWKEWRTACNKRPDFSTIHFDKIKFGRKRQTPDHASKASAYTASQTTPPVSFVLPNMLMSQSRQHHYCTNIWQQINIWHAIKEMGLSKVVAIWK